MNIIFKDNWNFSNSKLNRPNVNDRLITVLNSPAYIKKPANIIKDELSFTILFYPVYTIRALSNLSPAEQLQCMFQTALNGQEPSIPTIKGWQTNQEY